MADPNALPRVRGNVEKMINAGAPAHDIDDYLASEGHTPDSFRAGMQAMKAAPVGQGGAQIGPRPASGIGPGPDDRSVVRQAADATGQLARGLTDGITDTVGMPVDAAAWALRKAGVPVGPKPIGGSESLRSATDYVATLPGRVSDFVTQGTYNAFTDSRSARAEPQNVLDKAAYGAGRGMGGAASVAGPARLIAPVAGAVPTVAQRIAGTMAAAPGAQIAIGGASGAVGEVAGPVAGLATGMAAGFGPNLARRAITPQSVLSAEEQRLAQVAANEGIPLTVGQASGSKGWQLAESTLRKLPFSGNMMENQFDGQRRAFNRAVLGRAGIDADRATPGVIHQAFDDIGGVYADLIRRTGSVNIDRQFAQDVAATANEYGRMLGSDVAPKFRAYIDDLTPMINAVASGQNPRIDAAIYQTIRSKIGTRARATNDTDLREALYGLQAALDDAAARTAPHLAQEWDAVRRNYRNLTMIDTAMARAPQASATRGDIPFGSFKEAVRASDAGGYARGRGEMNDLARIGAFLADKIPDSGTAQRSFMTGVLTGGAAMNPAVIGAAAVAPTVAAAMRAAGPNYQHRAANPLARRDGAVVNVLNDQFTRRLEDRQ